MMKVLLNCVGVNNRAQLTKKETVFNIPKNIPHGLKVLSSSPIKVISTQSPTFFGKDRIYLDKE